MKDESSKESELEMDEYMHVYSKKTTIFQKVHLTLSTVWLRSKYYNVVTVVLTTQLEKVHA